MLGKILFFSISCGLRISALHCGADASRNGIIKFVAEEYIKLFLATGEYHILPHRKNRGSEVMN